LQGFELDAHALHRLGALRRFEVRAFLGVDDEHARMRGWCAGWSMPRPSSPSKARMVFIRPRRPITHIYHNPIKGIAWGIMRC
jgi:hypothetical protein